MSPAPGTAPNWSDATQSTTPRDHRHRAVIDVHLLFRDGDRILLGRRQNTGFGDGAYHPPSGHVEAGESVLTAAAREAKEEVGVVIDPDHLELVHVLHNAASGGRLAFFFAVDAWNGTITNTEPDKCSELRWFTTDQLPADDMIGYARQALQQYAVGTAVSTYGW